MDLSYDLLRTFIAVAETRNFTRAGELVNRTQSAVSQQIKRLEGELSQELFRRGARSVSLTPYGEAFVPHARRLLKAHEETVAALSRPDVAGVVRLGAPDDYAAYFLPGILERFASVCPLVQVEMRCESSTALLAALDSDELDLVIRTNITPSLPSRVIAQEPIIWATSASHCTHEVDPLPLAVFAEGCDYRAWGIQALENIGRPYRIAYTSPNIMGIQAAITAGLAVAPMGLHSMPPGARILGEEEGFPQLPSATVSLHRRTENGGDAVESLACYVVEAFRERRLDLPPERSVA
ncbi:LysR family transcriptional regulator [Oceanidesulfovibrio indonesiensis]|uniref:LysR family transcriptional regulator n=1 Tax=Oceanidesulfovibrio indonesiensis TaxID=54767 RepID=A0A7M3MIF3_9BACT|nr:LysR substrate-binding domain-containing protein [Oceanidesulfovibrio indonesiensis]TVM19474.1 LysR family transcriptional regulator [Oceanidesulfovibrio indonesiensis]